MVLLPDRRIYSEEHNIVGRFAMDPDRTLPTLDTTEALETLSDIRVVYTDLDGTLLAPGGRLLCDYYGNPSTAVCEALVALKRVGVQIVVVTGRSRLQGNEFIRILDADEFIGEMGTTIQQRGASELDVNYDTGTFEWDRDSYRTPYEAIAKSGAIEALLERYAGELEYNYPRCLNRDVTHAMRGNIDVDEAGRFLIDNGWNLSFEDNGMLFRVRDTTLRDTSEVHGYHVVPAQTSKAIAVRKDMERRGIEPKECVAVGDGAGDIDMGHYTGSLVVMANGLPSPRSERKLAQVESPSFITRGLCCDGWVEMANVILEAKGART